MNSSGTNPTGKLFVNPVTIERLKQLIDMWNILIGFNLEFRSKSIPFLTSWGRGDKISNPLSHKDRRPLKRAISQNSLRGT